MFDPIPSQVLSHAQSINVMTQYCYYTNVLHRASVLEFGSVAGLDGRRISELAKMLKLRQVSLQLYAFKRA